MRPGLLVLLLCATHLVHAQGVMHPLTVQGIEQQDPVAVRARGMGGVFAASGHAAEAAVLNPAGLRGLSGPALSVSGLWQARDWAETQHWNPNRYYAGLSLFFASPEDYRSEPLSKPDWTHRQSAFRLAAATGALPFRWGAVALAVHRVADLSDYDRNDNVLDPYIGQFRPEPVERPRPGQEIAVQWSTFERERTGALYAISPAIAVEIGTGFHLGLRVSRIWGQSTDRQTQINVGSFVLREDAHDYSHGPLTGLNRWSGTSEYTGWATAAGLLWEQRVITVGVLYQLPATVARTFNQSGTHAAPGESGSDFIRLGTDYIGLPGKITAGVSLRPVSSLMLAVDVFHQDYEQMEVSSARYAEPDWGVSRGVRVGLEWEPGQDLLIRGGFRRDPRPFRITGFGLLGQTATGDAFSVGLGYPLGGIVLDVAYEFQRLLYQDRWESNVDYNRVRQHNLFFQLSYAL